MRNRVYAPAFKPGETVTIECGAHAGQTAVVDGYTGNPSKRFVALWGCDAFLIDTADLRSHDPLQGAPNIMCTRFV